MARRHGGAPSQRQLRVGAALRQALTDVLRGAHFHDPVLTERSITVTEVRVSPDLKNATAFVMPLGGAAAESVLPALKRAAPYLRGQLGRQITLRYTPRLSFEFDASFDQAARVDALLRAATTERQENGDAT
ncbi:MAG: 30S ribosome-binding factor RbfA [Kiloniellales bacterium]